MKKKLTIKVIRNLINESVHTFTLKVIEDNVSKEFQV